MSNSNHYNYIDYNLEADLEVFREIDEANEMKRKRRGWGFFVDLAKRTLWKYYWIIEDELAIAPMPSSDVLGEIRKTFKTVISLEPPTFPLNLDTVKHYIIPVKDFTAETEPLLIALYASTIAKKPVLVHCQGGCGRSGTLATLYLVVNYGYSLDNALELVKKKRGCGPETNEQLKLIEKILEVIEVIV